MVPALKAAMPEHDIVHIHELWHFPAYAAAEAAKDAGKPYVVTIHGGLSDWAVNHKAIKKRVYMMLAQRRVLNGAACLQAFTDAEAAQIEAQGFENPVAVIPNGIWPQDFEDAPAADVFLNRFPETRGRRIVLFLGRLHPIKGLEVLIDSFTAVMSQVADAHLVIAGPDEGDYAAELRQRIEALGMGERVTFTGMLNRREKLSALRAAGVFALPSHSEGFSMTLLEALACGTPVIASRNCNFPEIESYGAGCIVDADPAELSAAIRHTLAPEARRDLIGESGKRLVSNHYTWPGIAERIAEMYRKAIESTGLAVGSAGSEMRS
jgi:glycosyltransferase involved in cell wall biosynthesis